MADELMRRIIAGAPIIVMTVDRSGTITWTDGALEPVTGYRPEELVGTHMFDHIDLEWNPRALESVTYALSSSGLQRPMLFRVRRKDATWLVVEITANAMLDDPVVDGLAVYIRAWDERYLLDLVIESLAAGDPLEHTLGLLVQVMGAETLEGEGAICLDPVGGFFGHVVASEQLDGALATPGLAESDPVRAALGNGEPAWARIDGLDPPLRRVAEANGFTWCWVWPVAGTPDPKGCLVLWRRRDEEPDYSCVMLLDRLVRITGLVLERAWAAADLLHAATTDTLTGLANRASFFRQLGEALADPDQGPLIGVLYLDIDDFKPVNDRLGHGAGDQVLQEIGRRLTRALGAHCTPARLGGDEFGVLCRGVVDRSWLAGLTERITLALERPIHLGDHSVSVGASAGFAVGPPNGASLDELLEEADARLYDNKRSRQVEPASARNVRRSTRR